MNVFRTRLLSAAALLSLMAAGAVFAQDDDPNSSADPAAPPVVLVPVVPEASGDQSPNGSSRDWRGEIAADREAKGWGPNRPRSQAETRQDWAKNYRRRDYYSGGQDRWNQIRDPQDRSDRIGQNRSSFTPMRPDTRSDAETQAQAYAALYWMMKAQAEQEQSRDRR